MDNYTKFMCGTASAFPHGELIAVGIKKETANKSWLRLVFAGLALLFCFGANKGYTATYINVGNSQLNVPGNWKTTAGVAATNFTTAGDIFNLNNAPGTQTFTTLWTLGSTSSGGGVTLNINTNVTMAASNSGILINGKVPSPGSMVIATGVTLDMNTGSANTITTSSNVTITNSGIIQTGCTAATPIPAVSYGGTVIYDGTSAQTPTATTYTTLIIDNSAGCNWGASVVTFGSGGSLELENGVLTLNAGGDLVMNAGSHIVIDQGTLSRAPTAATYTPTDITYTNLGQNFSGTTATSAFEWPNAYTGNVIINYSGVTFTIPANKTPDNLTVTAGTLTVATRTITLSGSFSNSGTTTFTNGTLSTNNFSNSGTVTITIAASINVSGSWANTGTFTCGTSTVTMNSASAGQTLTGNMTGSNAFYNLTFSGAGGWSFGANNADVGGVFTQGNGTLTAPSTNLNVAGNFVHNGGTFTHNSGTVTLKGSAAQTLPSTAVTTFYNLDITNASATVTANGPFIVNGTLSSVSGAVLNMVTSQLTGTLSASTFDGTLQTQCASNPPVPNNVTWGGTVSYNGSTGALGVSYGTYNNLIVTGTTATKGFTVGATTVNGSMSVTTTSGVVTLGGALTVAGNITITGSATANIFDVSSSNYQVSIAGNWYVSATSNVNLLNGRAGTVVFNGTGTQTIQSIGGAVLPNFFNFKNSNTSSTVSMASNTTVGGVMTNDLNATLSPGSTTLTVTGGWVNNGTFTAGTSTVNFNATSTGKTIAGLLSGTSSFYNLTFNGSGGGWSFTSNPSVSVTNNLTITLGTLTSTSGTMTVGGNYSNAGTFTSNSGTVLFNATSAKTLAGTLSGTSSFYDITFNGSGGSWSFTANPAVTATDNFTITTGTVTGTTNASGLTIGGNYSNSGTFTASTGTVIFNATTTGKTIAGTLSGTSSFNNLTFNGSGGGWSFTSNPSVTVSSNLVITTGTVTATSGTLTITGSYSNTGTFTNNGGTVLFNGTAARTIAGTLSGTSSFYNLTFNGTGGSWTFTANPAVTAVNNFTISAGSVTATTSASGLTIGGNFSNSGLLTTTGSTIIFNSSTAGQTIGGSTVTSFNNLTISNTLATTGAVSLSGVNATVSGTLAFTAGKFGINGRTLTLNGNVTSMSLSNAFSGSTASSLVIGGSSSYSIFFDQSTPGATNGLGTFTMGSSGTVTLGASSPMYVASTITLSTGTFAEGANTINVEGAWVNNNAGATPFSSTGTVVFDGTGPETIGGSNATSFYNLTDNNTSAALAVTVNTNVAQTLSVSATTTVNPSAAVIFNTAAAAGTITGQGMINVSIVGAYISQYKFSANNLGSMTLNYDAAGVQTINNTVGNYGALLINGSLTKTLQGNLTVNGAVTISAGTLAAGSATLSVGGDFTNNSAFTAGSSTVVFDGGVSQTISGTSTTSFVNVTTSVANTVVSVNATTNVMNVSGTLSVGANTIFAPTAATTINAATAGTISGSGTIEVTRTTGTPDYSNQYQFTTNTLSGLTVNYTANAAQSVDNAYTYGTLQTSTGGTKTALGNITVINGLNVGSGTVLDMTNNLLAGSGTPTYTVSGTLKTSVLTSGSPAPIPSGATWNGTGTVEYSGNIGTQTVVSGIYNNLQLDNTSGTNTAGAAITVNGQLTLGNLTLGANNITLGTSASISGASAANYIVANGTGYVIKQYAADGTFNYPIGDAANYSPLSLIMNGTGYSSAYAEANVGTPKYSNNNSSANYLSRYWTVNTSGISAQSYSVTATYVPGDITGLATLIAAGAYPGSLPWTKFGLVTTTPYTLTANSISSSSTVFTGVTNAAPNISVAPTSISICSGESYSLTATGGGDPALSYAWSPSSGLSATTGLTILASPTVTTTYTVTITDGNGFTNSATTTVSVGPLPAITGNLTICGAGSQTTTLANTTPAGIWTSSNTTIGSVGSSSGVVTGSSAGTATIVYSVTGCGSAVSTVVTVNPYVPGLCECTPTGNLNCSGGEYIGLVYITGTSLHNTTAGCVSGGWGVYPESDSSTASLLIGNSYVVNVESGTSTSGDAIETFVDFNKDGTFQSSEYTLVSNGVSTANEVYSNILAIPSAASVGYTTLRVRYIGDGATYGSGTACNATGADGEVQDYNICLYNLTTVNVAPASSTNACIGATPILSVTATGNSLSYQWYSNTTSEITGGAPIAGATNTTYSPSTASAGTYYYYCVITNVCGITATTPSSASTVVVNPVPTSTGATNNSPICATGTATLTANSTNATLWSWVGPTGFTSTLQNPTVSPTITGTYSLTLSNASCSSLTIYTSIVTVNGTPALTSANNSGPICAGATLGLSVTGASNVTGYVWTGPVAITSSTSASASVPSATTGASGIYTVTVNNGTGSGCTATYTTSATVNNVPALTSANNSGPICAGGTLNLSVTGASNVTGYVWSGPVAISSSTSPSANVPSATTGASGIYSVTVNNGSGAGCTATYTTSATVNNAPTLTSANNDGPICAGATLNLSVTGASNVTGYIWSGPVAISSSTSASANVPSATTGASGIYSVSVNNGSGSGCTATYTTSATVNSAPTLTSANNNGPICAGATLNLSVSGASNVTGYVWSGPVSITSSTSASATVPSATTGASGVYSVTVNDGSGSGCTATYTTSVTVNNAPTLTSANNNSPICTGATLNLSVSGASNVTGYAWTGPVAITSSTSASASVPSATTGATGIYTVNVNNGAGPGCIASYTTAATVNSAPTLTSANNNSPICMGATLNLSVTGATNVTGYVWTGPVAITNSTLSSASVPSATTGASGIYTITVNNGSGSGCTAAYTTSATINPVPSSTGATNNGPICNGGTVTLNDNSSNATAWSWAGSDGSNSALQTPAMTPTATTTYSLTVSSAGAGCSPSTVYTTTVTVNAVPTSTGATNSGPICNGGTVTLFDNSSYATAWSWTGSDGSTSTTQSPIMTPTATTTYSLTLSSSGSGCNPSTVYITTVTVNAVPTSTGATNSGPICNGGTVTLFDHSSNATAWSWTGSDGSSSSIQSPAMTPTATTTYSLTLSSAGAGCNPAIVYTTTVTVNTPPTSIGATNNGPICNGGTVTLNDHSVNATAWSWIGSDGSSSNLQSPAMTPSATTTYSLTLSSTGSGCNPSTVYTTIVTVNAVPTSTGATNSGPICIGAGVTLYDNSSNATAWSWTGSDGSSSTAQSPAMTPTATTTYSLTISSTGSGCSPSMVYTTTVTVNAVPTSTGATNSGPICNGGTVTLYDNSSNASAWAWIGSDGSSSTIESPAMTPTATTTYSLTLSSSGSGCNPSTVYTTTVTISPQPVSTGATNSGPICNGASATLYDNSANANEWQWMGSDGYSSTLQNPMPTPTVTTTYSLTVGYTASGCNSSGGYITTVTVNAVPSSSGATNGGPICNGGTVTLFDNSSNATAWSWTGSDGSSSTLQSPVMTPTATTTYSLTLSSLGTGCNPSTVYTTIVTVNSAPSSTGATNSGPICNGANVTLYDNSSNATTWSWIGSDGSSSGTESPVMTPTATTTYSLTLSNGAASGCSPSAVYTTIVTVNALPATVTASGSGTFCGNTTITASNGGDGTIYFQGTISGGTSTATPSGTQVVSVTGTYYFRALSASGCWGGEGSVSVTINPTPTGINGNTNVCVNSSTNLSDATVGGVWTISNTLIATIGSSSGIVTAISAGIATVTYTLNAGCTDIAIILSSPVAAPISGNTTVCTGTTTFLSDPTLGGSWTSSDGTIANVSLYTGVVTAISAGTATISYSLSTGCVETAVVTVDAASAGITGSMDICIGLTATLSDVTGTGVWSSGNTSVATVGSSSGVVNAVSAGPAVISYALPSGCISTWTIFVHNLPSTVAVSGGGSSYCASATLTASNGNDGTIYYQGSTSGGTSTAMPSTVQTVTVSGTYYFRALSTSGCWGAQGSATVTINALPSAISGAAVVCAGSTTSLSDATAGGTWSSSNANATINGSGVVSGINAGTATITYTAPTTCIATTTVTINGISAISGPAVCAGVTSTLTDAVTGGTWSSSNGSVATIGSSNGLATGIAQGTATIVYTLGTGCTASTIITVNTTPSAISGTAYVCAGLTTTLTDGTASGTWSSSSNAIATIGSSTGTVTGVIAGTATITYLLPTGCKTTSIVTVGALPATISGTAGVCNGLTTTLSDATAGGTWSSSNSTNASVGSTGIVTGIATGTDVITYTLGTSCLRTLTVTVNPLTAITGSSPVCAGTTLNLNETTPGGAWSSSNGSVATVGSSTGIVAGVSGGTATVTYLLPTGCQATTAVTINALPAAISGNGNVCTGLTTSLSDASGGGTWSSSNIALATAGSTGIITGISAGTATITYTLGTGCQAITTVTVNPLSSITGAGAVCVGSTTNLNDAVAGGTWSSGNTPVATITAGTVSGISAGTATITYSLTTGCTATLVVTVNNLPSAITGTGNACIGTTLPLGDATSGGAWSSGNTAIATIDVTGIVTGTGAGIVTINYTSGAGCISSAMVTVNPVPSAITGNTTVCAGATTSLYNTVPGGIWSSSNVNYATVDNSGNVTGVAGGTAMITYSMASGCYATTTVTVSALQPITGTFSACMGSTTALNDATTGGTWSSSNPSVGSVDPASGVVAGLAYGSTTITYTLASGCSRTVAVAVNASPSAISGPSSVCSGSTITLSDASAGGTWSSSSFAVSVGSTTGIITGSGAYTGVAIITYTAGAGCTVSQAVTVNPVPTAIQGASTECAGTTITLTDAFGGGTWSGSGNVTVATIGTNSGTVTGGSSAGTGTVTYSLASGCYMTYPNTVYGNPAAITGTFTVCAGGQTALSDATPGVLNWSSSNIAVATAAGYFINGVAAGTTIITYQTLNGCIATQTVTVNGLPAESGSMVVCAGSTITLSDASAGGTWSSSNTSVATAGSGSGIITGVSGGTVSIYYTGTSGCSTSATVTVNPMLPITGSTGVCVSTTTNLADATNGGRWSSSAPSIATIGSTTGLVTALTTPGTATMTYSVAATGCSTTTVVTVNTTPGAINGNLSVCPNGVSPLSDATGGGTWRVSNGFFATIGSTTGILTGNGAGYTGAVTISYTAGGCVVTATATINPNPTPIQGSTTTCVGATITLTDATPGGTWSGTGDVTVATLGSNSGTVTGGGSAGSGTMTYTLATGCYVNTSGTVYANPLPITGTFTVCAGSVTALTDATPGVLSWSSSNTSVAIASGFDISGVSAGTATITYQVFAGGCIATQVVTVSGQPAVNGNTPVCTGSTITLSDAVAGGAWSSSNTLVATIGTSGILTALGGGTAVISYTGSVGCSTLATVTVNPIAAITGNTRLCMAESITLSDAVTGGVWSSSNAGVATIDPAAGSVTPAGSGTTTISYIMSSGCSATSVVTVTPAIASIAGTSQICSNVTTSLSDATAGGSWSSSDITIGTVNAATGVVAGVSAGAVNITYSIGSGCVTTYVVTMIAAPAAVQGSALICAGLTTALSDQVPDGTWSSSNVTVAYVSENTGLVTGITGVTAGISYTALNGCYSAVVVTVNSLVSSVSGTTTLCTGATDNLTDASSGGTWSSSDNTIATVGSTGIVTGVSGGYATITYTLGTGCSNAFSVVVNPFAGTITGPSAVDGDSVIHLADGIGGGSWSSSTAHATVDGSGNVSGVSGGTTIISYTVNNICGSAIATKTLTVNAGPAQVVVSGGGTFCGSATLTASNGNDGIIYYEGTNAVGTSTLTPSTSQVVSTSGTYYFRAQSSAGAWGNVGSATVTINPAPGSITGTATVCAASTTALTDVTTGGTWSSSNTSNATVNGSGNVTGITGGTATIIYTLPAGCTATSTVTINSLPSAISGSSIVCSGLTTTLSSSTAGGTWSSVVPAKGTIGPSLGVFTAISAGTTTISYVLPTGCYVTTTETVAPLPSAITGTATVCVGLSTALTDVTTGGAWSSNNINMATVSSTGVVTGITSGTPGIVYTLPTGCTATKTVTVNALPSTITGSSSVCVGAVTALNSSTGGGTWSSSNTTTATVDGSGNVTGVAAGTTNITYTVSTGCVTSAGIVVNALPATVTAGGAGAFCGSTTITAANGGDGTIYFQGTTSGGISTATASASQVVSTSGTYYFRALSVSGCWGVEGSVTVTINPVPSNISGTPSVCAGLTTSLSDAAAGGTWSSSNTANATVDGSGNVTGVAAGTSNITYTLPTGCNTTNTITVYGVPPVINGVLGICPGSSTSLSNNTAGGIWSSASTTIATIGSISGIATGSSAGVTAVTYGLSTGCITTANLTVNALPSTVIASGAGAFCGSTTITAANGGSGTIYFQGTTSGGTSTNTPSASQVVTNSGTYYFRAQSASGCWGAEGSVTVTINAIPAAISGNSAVCIASVTGLTNATPGGAWSSSNTANATVDGSGNVTGVSAGTATIAYTQGTGCASSITMAVNSLPAVISGSTGVCLGATATLSDVTAGGTWSSGNNFVATVSSGGLVTGLVQGNATISYTLATGCSATTGVTINPQPTTITGSTGICLGATNTLVDGLSGGTWTSAATGVATIDGSGNIIGLSTGTSSITYAMPTGCIATTTATVNPISAILNNTGVCIGNTVTLSDATTGGAWSSSNTSVAAIGTTGIVNGTGAGTASVVYTMPTGCTATVVMTVNAAPSAITGNTVVCVGLTSALTDAGGGTWGSSNPSVVTVAASGVVTGAGAGTAIITYTLPTGCTATIVVSVNQVPGTINGTTNLCAGSVTTLSNAVTGGAWSSNNTTVATIGAASGIATAVAGGTSVVTYTMAAGCYSTTVMTVNTILPVSGILAACVGSTTTLTDASTGGTWSSSNLSVATIGGTTGIASGIMAGTATISYTIPSGCVRTATLAVNPLPAAISGPSSVCAGSTITLSDAVTGGTWSGSSLIESVATTTGVVTASNTYTGTATITYTAAAGCAVTQVVSVNANPTPVQGAAVECAGTTITLSDAVAGGTWSGGGDASVSGTGSTGTLTAGAVGGSATITYTLANGCYTTYANTIFANPQPIAGTFIVCVGSVTILSDASSGNNWSSSSTAVAVASGPNISGVSGGTATITFKSNTAGSCTVTQVITVNSLPAVAGNVPVCAGSTITLSDASGGTWSSSNTLIATIGSGTGVVTGVAGGSVVINFAGSAGCAISVTVTVNPILPITGSGAVCVSGTASLADATNGGLWSSGNPSIATIGSATGVVTGQSTTGTSTITYAISATGCAATKVVTVNQQPGAIQGSLSLCANAATTLTDVVAGGNWTISNGFIATIGSATGTVTGSSGYTGTATISYATGSCVATAVLTVNANPTPIQGAPSECSGITITLSDATTGGTWSGSGDLSAVTLGSNSGSVTGGASAGTGVVTYTLATGCFATASNTIYGNPQAIAGTFTVCAGSITDLTDASSSGNWTSSNTTIAVASGPDITGVAAGTATITFKSSATGSCMAMQVVTVDAVPVMGAISGTLTVAAGGTVTLTDATTPGTWSSNNVPVAIINSSTGVLNGVNPGNATITYSSVNSYGCSAYTTAAVTVTASGGRESQNGNGVNICVGSSVILNDVAAGGTWSIGNNNVAIVDNNGMVTGMSEGSTAVTYTIVSGFGNSETIMPVVVNGLPGLVNVTANRGTNISAGEMLILTAVTSNEGSNPSYQWLINGVAVQRSNSPVFASSNLADNDSVSCQVTSSGACGGIVTTGTLIISVGNLGANNVAATFDVKIFPNPNKGVFTLKGNIGTATDETVTVEVTDVLGQVIYKNNVTAHNGVVNETVSLGGMLDNGMYMLNMHGGTLNRIFHFVIGK